MQYMVIEKFKSGRVKDMYKRFEEKGRMLPEGVRYVTSYISNDVSTCWQVMEAVSPDKLNEWIDRWNDLVDFEVIPVISSAEAKQKALT